MENKCEATSFIMTLVLFLIIFFYQQEAFSWN